MSSPPPHDNNRVHVPDDRGLRKNMADWRPSRRALLVIGAAFAIGLLLFLLMWWRDRGQEFYRADATAEPASEQQFEPLPTPLPGDAAGGDSRLGQPAEDAASPAVGTIEHPPTARAPVQPPRAAPPQPDTAAAHGPVAISSPSPDYPPDAFRRGESGTVVLRIHVGPDGIPYSVDLVQSSRSRSLDRAASDAVRRWRFQPAQRAGQPVAGEVQVPIVFTADR